MKKTFFNNVHIEGYLYEHNLEKKVTGATSKNPNTEYITGTISVATDDAYTNIVPIHFSYVTALTSQNKPNATFNALNNIIEGKANSVMGSEGGEPQKLKIDTAIGLNEFYTDRNGKEELVSAKRNEGGFVHFVNQIAEDEKNNRNLFDCDMLITNVTRKEADEEKNIPEKVILKGMIFDFRKAILPVEFTVLNEKGMDYFEGLDIGPKNPVFTRVKGQQITENIVRRIVEENAFGEDYVREITNNRKEYVVNHCMPVPYELGNEDTLTSEELKKAMSDRETYLATVKQRADEYKASRASAKPAAAAPVTNVAPSKSSTDFEF